MQTLPKLKRSTDKEKITLYIDREVGDLYRSGKQNGWDVSEIVRRAATDALKSYQLVLAKKAD